MTPAGGMEASFDSRDCLLANDETWSAGSCWSSGNKSIGSENDVESLKARAINGCDQKILLKGGGQWPVTTK